MPFPGRKPKVLVLDPGLRSPPFAEGIHDRTLVGDRPLHHAIEFLVQIVVEPGQAERQRPHLAAVEQIAPDEIERRGSRLSLQARETLAQRFEEVGDWMLKALDDDELHVRRGQL